TMPTKRGHPRPPDKEGDPTARKPQRLKPFPARDIKWLFFEKPEKARKPAFVHTILRVGISRERTEKKSREDWRGIASRARISPQNREKQRMLAQTEPDAPSLPIKSMQLQQQYGKRHRGKFGAAQKSRAKAP